MATMKTEGCKPRVRFCVKGALVAAALCALAFTPSYAATNITENVTLTEDADWTEFGTVTVAAGATVNLNGHSLRVVGLAGAGRIVDGDIYRRVEYIQADQNGAVQCIDTGYRHNAKTEVDVRVAYTAPGNYQVVYGARNTSDNDTQFGVWLNGSKFMRQTCQKSASTPASGYGVTANRVYDIHISKSGANTVASPEDSSVNYDLANGNGVDGNNTSGNDFLLAINQSNSSSTGSWPCKCKVWFCKIYDNGTLVRDFVPVVRKPDGEAGFFDTVNNQFYGKKNANAEALVAGPTISGGLHLVISPDATYDLSGLEIDAECISEGGTLTGDIDWSGLPNLTVESGATIDLAGHKLYVSSVSGSGTITDSVGTTLSGFERIEYLQASGTQYIDTGYIHDNSTKVDMRIKFDSVSQDYQSFYGARNSKTDTEKGFSMWLNKAKFRRAFGGSAGNIDSHTVSTSTIYDIHLDKSGACTATPEGGEAIDLGSGTQGDSLAYTDYLFAINQYVVTAAYTGWKADFLTRAKLYSCKIYSGTALVRDFIPVRRTSDGVLGLLDLAQGVFYTNAGSGKFTAGTVVATTPGGELRIAVAEGKTVEISETALCGTLKLVKTGEGTLVMSKASQGYAGGTDVQGGTLKGGAAALVFGAEKTDVAVGSAGNVDLNGNANLAAYGWTVADGGTIVNGGAVIASSLAVSGVFSPVVTTGDFAASLSDGATLDFTKWTGEFPVASPAITFVSGANIALKLEPATTAITALARSKDAETGKPNGYLFSWDSPPTDVAFSSDAATRARFRVVPDENGLRVSLKAGICIIIR